MAPGCRNIRPRIGTVSVRFRTAERLRALSAAGDPLQRLRAAMDFELFRAELDAALGRSDRAKGGRPPYDPPGADVQGAGTPDPLHPLGRADRLPPPAMPGAPSPPRPAGSPASSPVLPSQVKTSVSRYHAAAATKIPSRVSAHRT